MPDAENAILEIGGLANERAEEKFKDDLVSPGLRIRRISNQTQDISKKKNKKKLSRRSAGVEEDGFSLLPPLVDDVLQYHQQSSGS